LIESQDKPDNWTLLAKEKQRLIELQNEHSWSELVCEICSCAEDEENMIICDACDLGYHLQCLGDTDSANDLDFNILEDDWTCGACDASGDDSEANGSDDEGSCSDSSAHASE
jgi:hypothetical protein